MGTGGRIKETEAKTMLKWGIQSAEELLKWNKKIELIKEIPKYKNMVEGLSEVNQMAAEMSDKYKIMYMIHLKTSE